MTPLYQIKESEVLDTPVLLFDFQLRDGTQFLWSTHPVNFNGQQYSPRVLKHDAFEMRFAADGISEAGGRIFLTLANADGLFAPLDAIGQWKGGDLNVRFAFFDLATGEATSDSRVLFRGTCSGLDDVTESAMRLSFHNRQAIQRATLPSLRVQARCPWQFPTNSAQRLIGVDGGQRLAYSPFYPCGYSPDMAGGVGNIGTNGVFTSCDRTRTNCEERGMFSIDSSSRVTARFGGFEMLGESETALGESSEASPGSGELVPIVYGTCWIEPPIALSQQTGGLRHYQLILSIGPIQGPIKVLVNRFEVPEFHEGLNAEATGWYRFVSAGDRSGIFDPDLPEANGYRPTGPYGSLAYLHIAVPGSIHSSRTLPRVEVLVDGLLLQRHDEDGTSLGHAFTKNPAWILLDILKRTGWQESDLDLASFARMAAFCDFLIETSTPSGEVVYIPRYRCNLALQKKRSVSEIMRGIHLATGLYIKYLPDGRLSLTCEHTLAVQSPSLPEGSNSPSAIEGGWPAYEFGDGTYGFSGIARKDNGEPTIRFWSRGGADTPNKVSLDFWDEFNQYQKDSLTVSDSDDILAIGQEIAVGSKAIGVPNFSQASRSLSKQLKKSTQGNLYVEFDTSVKGIALSPGDIITITYLHAGMDRTPFRIIRIAPSVNCALIHIVAQLHNDEWYAEDGAELQHGTTQTPGNAGSPRPLLGPSLEEDGNTTFTLTEYEATEYDGSASVLIRVDFLRPPQTTPGAAPAPRLSLQASVNPSGGTLHSGTNLYYAVSGVDGEGNETKISPIVKATLGPGVNTYSVLLQGLAFDSTTAYFHVYRGQNPYQLLRIASSIALAASFEDTGLAPQAIPPPDDLFDHANFYWRFEWLPPTAATIYSAGAIGSSTLSLNPNECIGKVVRIVSGKGVGQEREIESNDSTTVTTKTRFLTTPDGTSVFSIAEASWHFGASSRSSFVEFEVPNRSGATIQIVGRAASASDWESDIGLSPLGRLQLDGAAGQATDAGPPPMPSFGLSYSGKGSVALIGISFPTLVNTISISSGELVLHYWNELGNPSPFALASAITELDTSIQSTVNISASAGDLVQVDTELMVVAEVLNSGTLLIVQRGAFGTAPISASVGTALYPLSRNTSVVPFSRGFFGSPANGTYHYSIHLPGVRIAAAELSMVNNRGTSPVRQQSFTASVDRGLRTLTGGQYSIQVNGHLALQTAAAPPLVIEASHCVQDIYAVIAEAPVGGPVDLILRQNGVPYAYLSIAPGNEMSNVINGVTLPPLTAQAIVTLDIVAVPADTLDTPGRDLTLVIRI